MKFDLTIKQRLFALSLGCIAFIVAVAVTGYIAVTDLNRAKDEIALNGSALKNQLEADMAHDALRGDVLAALLTSSKKDAEKDEVRKATKEHAESFREAIKELEAASLNDKIKQALQKVRPTMDAYLKSAESTVELAFSDIDAAHAKYPEFVTSFGNLEKEMEGLSEFIEENTKETTATGQASAAKAQLLILVVSVVAVVFGLLLAYLTVRSLLKRLGGELAYAVDVVQRISGGDLTIEVTTRKGDSESLLARMQKMQRNLHQAVSDIRGSTQTITTASQQIAAGNADLSQRTEEQASSLQQSASSMEELSSAVKQNTENARQANQLAAGASQVAVKGGQVVKQVVDTMGTINASSKKIVDIISVIDGIAFQTNILALNAAVEAARAGEQGRGFAVVASEVRTLAQRSAAAAKEIKELISDSVHKVQDGARLVDDAGQTMDEIVAAVKRVTDIMADIAAASQEQSSGIEQVNQAVMQMDQVTQQNAALVEEAAAAADSMQQQAQTLSKAVAVFKVTFSGEEARAAVAENAEPVHGKPRVERRGPNRAKNVSRLQKDEPKPEPQAQPRADAASEPMKTGTDGEWSEF
jgi:methyl-accepting chemotaxis protein